MQQQSFGNMQTMASNVFSAYASVAGSVMLFRSLANDTLPEPIRSYFFSVFRRIFCFTSTQITVVVDENSGMAGNQIYQSAEVYLHTKMNPNIARFKISKKPKKRSISLSMDKNELVLDTFKGIELKWLFFLEVPANHGGESRREKRYFELTFDKKYRELVLTEYLPFIMQMAEEIKEKDRNVKLYTKHAPYYLDDNDVDEGGNRTGEWGCVNLDHPITFDKLAMDPKLKKQIIEDLDRFLRRKEYYKKVGKPWKRGYLLYGPPGTGKSSLIAAMANYLKFDIYDLELASIYTNLELKRTLLSTTNRSIIVIEDVDCTAPMLSRDDGYGTHDGVTKITLSGMLNFMDGLWSNCGDERIIIFTTNHREKLDPALLRPGRMDMHIHMSYCTPAGLDVLTYNYLAIQDHPRLDEIKALIEEVPVTPAEIVEHLMRNENAELALEGVFELLKTKKSEANVERKEECAAEEESDDDIEVQEKAKGAKISRKRKFMKPLRSFREKRARGQKKDGDGYVTRYRASKRL